MTLQEAIAADNVDKLYISIESNKNLLDDAGPFTNTPLHNATKEGKTQVAMEIATLKPSFTRKLNCRGYSPMHLALLNKHYNTARALMTLDPEVIRVRGRDGYTPLHFVAGEKMQDQEELQELLAEILSTCKSSIEDLTNQCETAVHVAVKKGNTKALEILLGWLKRVRLTEILNWKDQNDNTVLHIAVSGQQQLQAGQQQLPVAISGQQQLLVQLPAAVSGQQQLPAAVSAAVSGQQQLLTAVSGQQQLQAGQQQLPVAVSGQQQLPVAVSKEQQLEIINLLIGYTNVHAKNLQHKTALQICRENPNCNQDIQKRLSREEHQTRDSTRTLSLSQYFSRELTVHEKCAGYFGTKNENVRQIILIVSTLILTATYQSAFTPPGGYWQDSSPDNPANSTVVTTNSSSIVTGKPHQAGNIIVSGFDLWCFTILNSLVFTASIGTVWATAITFFPETLMVYISLVLLGITYFVLITMEIPRSDKGITGILFGFYVCSLLTMLLLPLCVWRKHYGVLSRIDARRGCVGSLRGSKDRK